MRGLPWCTVGAYHRMTPAYHRMTPAYTYNLFAGAQHTGSNHGTHPRDKATGPKVQNVILTVKLQFGSLLNFS